MKPVRFTRLARQDLLEIWLHVARRRSDAFADRILERIEERCRLLSQHPLAGPARPDIAESARMLVIERWLALYSAGEDAVQVVRILDGARDLTTLEWTPE